MFRKRKPSPAIKLTQLSSLIAEGVVIEGDLVFSQGLRIDGQVHGQVTGRAASGAQPALLVLSQTGAIEGSVHCGNALINGSVTGDLEIDDYVELQAGARITGTLRYRQLQMDVGAVVQGQLVRIGDDAVASSSAEVVELKTEPRAARQ